MPVYMVAEVKKKDKLKYNEYIAALTEMIEKYRGRAGVVRALCGRNRAPDRRGSGTVRQS